MTRLALPILASFFVAPAVAEDPYVPPALEEWRDWVLHGEEWRDCPVRFDGQVQTRGAFFCAWPKQLSLAVGDDGAEFSQVWTIGGDVTHVPLPGGAALWPERVTVDGRPALVLEKNGEPVVEMAPGQHTVAGRILWASRPGELRVPSTIGLVDLRIDGQRILNPELEGGLLFLGEDRPDRVSEDAVNASVYRLLSDGSPSRLTTELRIRVSGGLREESFGPLLPEGFVPEYLGGGLPARFEADGRLSVQVRPGEWTLRLRARAEGTVNEVGARPGGVNMPAAEILSFQTNDSLRVVVPGGLPPVDPAQADVPPDWQGFPAFRLGGGEALVLEERSRGVVDSENALSLTRRLWLDFDGSGLTARDVISGEMRKDWRLDMRNPFILESASVNGERVLVTEGEDADLRGVEIRQRRVALEAVARIAEEGQIPVTGWDSRFNGVTVTLELPPGRRLIAAPGTDQAVGAWLGRWQLLDMFLLLVITAATWRLFGRAIGITAFTALFLTFHEAGAPSWLWLNLLAAAALLRVAPAGRLQQATKGYFYLGLLALLVVLIPYAADQLRYALFPQLAFGPQPQVLQFAREVPAARRMDQSGVFDMPQAPETAARALEKVASDRAASAVEEVVVNGAQLLQRAPASDLSRSFERYAPNALVQAGPGLPDWQWQRYTLRWSGPVEAGQAYSLVIAPPWLMSVWRILSVLLMALLAARFVAEALQKSLKLPAGLRVGRGNAVGLAILALLIAIPAGSARADIPNAALLEELRSRLTEPPECLPRCAEFVAARVNVEADRLTIEIDVHASIDAVVPLPGGDGDWVPRRIDVDGEPAIGINRQANHLLVFVARGQHSIRMSGELPSRSSINVPFPEAPRVIDVTAEGWAAAGVVDRRLVTGSLQLDRIAEDADGEAGEAWVSSRFPVFVSVERRLELGLDWRVYTQVSRVAPSEGALEVAIPLLAGESVLTEAVDVQDGIARVAMPPGEHRIAWVSGIEPDPEVTLVAGDGTTWQETWLIAAGSIWHVEFSGVPESVTQTNVPGARVAAFHPRPGESLQIRASRPGAAAGSTTAIDAVRYETSTGRRLVEAQLAFDYRATRGEQHAIRLPADAEVTTVSIDGRTDPLRPVDGVLTVPILPGAHTVTVGFRLPEDQGMLTRAPVIDIGAPASNISSTMNVSPDRWLIATSGPLLGPAVLYWPELLVLAGLALLLGRISWTPLRSRHWLLLALGFSTFNWPVLALVAAWLIFCGAREHWPLELNRARYNSLQVVHAALTVLALIAVVVSLPVGLLGYPDMHVIGNGSSTTQLQWFVDQVPGALPRTGFLSLPLWSYKALILVWALWLTFALLAWLPWVWRTFARDGLWQPRDVGIKPAQLREDE